MTSGIYRRLDFGINIPDESVDGPCQCVSPKEVVDSGPSRKRKKISDFSTSEEESVRSPRIAVKALKGLLEKKQKKVKKLSQELYLQELRASKEVQILKKLEEEVSQLDASLYCELEAISGYHQSVAFSVYPRNEKNFSQELGTYHPVRLLLCPSGHYKLQVLIYKTVDEGQIRVIDVLRLSSITPSS